MEAGRRRTRWRGGGALAALTMALLVALAACGATSEVGGTGTGNASAAAGTGGTRGTPGSTSRTVVATAVATASGTPIGPAAHAMPYDVTLTPGATHYAVSDAISVTIRNKTSQIIYVMARATECTSVALERLAGAGWELVKPCEGGNPHLFVSKLAPGEALTVELSATAPAGDAIDQVTPGWPAGTYRAMLTYSSSGSEALSQGAVAYSATFTVG